MNDKSAPKKRADRVEEEAKALRANLERRKKQIERRKILQKQKDVDYASDHCPIVSTVEF